MKTPHQSIEQAMKAIFQEYLLIAQVLRSNLPEPDFIIGDDYLQRWWLAKIEAEHDADRYQPFKGHTRMTTDHNAYLHRCTGSDEDSAFHDHPWANASLILEGEYIEHTPIGRFVRGPGDMVFRRADELHRLEIKQGPVWSLFVTGNKVREWGFDCPNGWRHWKVFTSYDETGDSSRIGRGCGE
jgi:hypothetical protein